MDKKRTLLCGLAIIGVCILAVVILLTFNRTTEREATPEEMEAYAHYVVDWQSLPIAQEGMTDKEIILSLCTYSQEEVIGENNYGTYTSEELSKYLYNCDVITEIAELELGALHIAYTDKNGYLVILGYDEEGLHERVIYNPRNDTMFHDLEGTVVVWEKYTTGIRLG